MDGRMFSYELSPTLFNIYTKEIIVKWKTHLYKSYYFINRNKKIHLLFADDQVIKVDSEDLRYKTQQKFWKGNVT
jgi:hypothetical protein